MGAQPVGIFAYEEGYGGDFGGNDAASCGVVSSGVEGRGMRRKTAPSGSARQTEVIKIAGIVAGYSGGEDVPLPATGRNFEALQLADDFEGTVFAAELCPGSDMLPAQKPGHELRGGDGSNLLAQRGHR